MNIQECIEFMQREITLAYCDGVPYTAECFKEVLRHLYMVDPNK
jgi:hypothetical protein